MPCNLLTASRSLFRVTLPRRPKDALTSPSTLLLSDEDVRALLSWEDAIAALRQAYAAAVKPEMLPPRTIARNDGAWLRSLTAAPPGSGVMGAKLIAAARATGRASYLIALFDRETTELVALLDGNHVTGARTAATSMLAVDLLAPDRPLRVAVIGSGFEARNHVRALAVVRPIASLAVFSPTAAHRERFAMEAAGELGVDAEAAERPEDIVADADLVIAAARSRDEAPIVRGDWLRPGMTVVSIGSTIPEQREVDAEAVRRATVIVADRPDEVARDTGDMLDATAHGVRFEHKLVALCDVVAGTAPGRRHDEDTVLYKSTGSALQDLAIAELCVGRARESGAGETLSGLVVSVAK